MAKKTRIEAFRAFGAIPKNQQWSRSARTSDGKSVIVTLWQDRLKYSKDGLITYEHSPTDGWFESHGQRELLENLIWAEEHCASKFKVIVAIAEDRNAIPRKVATSEPEFRYEMILTALDRTNGAFTARSVIITPNAS